MESIAALLEWQFMVLCLPQFL